jgi:hypothetical protein
MLDIVYETVTSAPTETIVDLYRAGGWWFYETLGFQSLMGFQPMLYQVRS